MTEEVQSQLLDLRLQFLHFLERRVHDRDLAEDILQSAYLRALRARAELRDDDSAVAWFYRILRNALIDTYRRQAAEGNALEQWARTLQDEEYREPVLQETICQCIAGALEALAPAYRDLLREVDLGEASLASYAKAHGITASNAAVRAHRARAALRNRLTACCGIGRVQSCVACTCRV